MTHHIAIDLGAESGRVVLGDVRDDGIHIDELNRFPTKPVHIQGHWRWNVYRIYEGILEGLGVAAQRADGPVTLGVDTWGVDFGLLAADGSLLGLPVAYRDDRTEGMMERFFERVPRDRIYAKTGIQFMRLNSLYQLFAVAEQDPDLFGLARCVLFMPDLFHYFLCGQRATEFTFATTTQLMNVHDGDWDLELCDALGLKRDRLCDIQPTGALLRSLDKDVAEQSRLNAAEIVLPATHDTGSAVAAIPAEGEDWGFISSGTWSLMGTEIRKPVCSEAALRYNFTNEGGVGGTYRLLKNIMGLWIVQRLRDELALNEDYSALTRLAEDSPAFGPLIDPDAEDFYHPPSMKTAIENYCAVRNVTPPETLGGLVRCALESLALRYRQVIDELRDVLDKPIARIHIVGGGSQNRLLCQWTANATGLPVCAGPVESTALGNVMAQAVGTGALESFAEGRTLVRRMARPVTYMPREFDQWDEAYERFQTQCRLRPNPSF